MPGQVRVEYLIAALVVGVSACLLGVYAARPDLAWLIGLACWALMAARLVWSVRRPLLVLVRISLVIVSYGGRLVFGTRQKR